MIVIDSTVEEGASCSPRLRQRRWQAKFCSPSATNKNSSRMYANKSWFGCFLSMITFLQTVAHSRAFSPLRLNNRKHAKATFSLHLSIFSLHASSSTTTTIASSSSTRNGNKKKNVKNPWTIHDADLLHRRFHPKYVPPEEELDYIIIGSGIGGLWLGACLAKFNKTVLVLEQHDIVGGFQHTFRRGRYEFVPGLHYIANLPLCAPLYDMVASMPNDLPPITYCQSGNSVQADEGKLCSHDLKVGSVLPPMQVKEGLENVQNELYRVFPQERKAIDEFLKIMQKAKWQAGQFATFKIFPPWIQWILSQTICSNYIHYASLTTQQVLEPLSSDGRFHTVLSAFGGDLGESLNEGSFVMQAAVLGHVLEGCYYPQGGPIHFVRGLVPTIRQNGKGDVLVHARVDQILLEEGRKSSGKTSRKRAVGVRLENGHVIRSKYGVVSDAGIPSTLHNLLPPDLTNQDGPLHRLQQAVQPAGDGISHVFLFVGLNATNEQLNLRSSSFYYIPWNDTLDDNSSTMDATEIQDFYRDTLLDPNVLDVSAGMVFCSAKDPYYSNISMPGCSTVVVFSEARAQDFDSFVVFDEKQETSCSTNEKQETSSRTSRTTSNHGGVGVENPKRQRKLKLRAEEYTEAKELIKRKMMQSLLLNFPHLKDHIDFVEVGTPLTLFDYTLRSETLGLRHTPQRMTNLDIRPDCGVEGLYFTGQDIAFAGWAGALTGAMVTAQRLLGYTLFDFTNGKTLMRDLGRADVEDMIQSRVSEATKASPIEVLMEIIGNGLRHIQRSHQHKV